MSTFSTSSRQKRLKTLSFLHFWLRNVLRATTACTFSTSEPPKVVRDRQFLTLLTSKCASRHNGVHFFDISTSKSAPRMVCFVHFHFEMCFAPQRRALFRHLNFQKWSDIGVFCAFCLPNVLRATTACTFSTSQLPKVVRSSSVLSILTWKCASRHNGMHFFMSHLASWLRTRRFSEPTFRPSGATNHWKNTVNRDFPIFSRIYLFFLLIFSLLTLLTSAFQLSILSEVSLLNFLRWLYQVITSCVFVCVCVFLLWRSRGKLLTLVPGCFFVFRFFPVVLAPACEWIQPVLGNNPKDPRYVFHPTQDPPPW